MGFGWRRANQVMVAVNLVAGALLLAFLIKGAPAENPALKAREIRRIDAALRLAKSSSAEGNPTPRRDLFKAGFAAQSTPKIAPAAARAPAAPRVPLAERAAHLKLVGIISGNPPQAMVEDTQAGKTLYVSPGESIGEIQVKEVTAGKIVVAFEGEQMEISL